jgi:hypothetical protein
MESINTNPSIQIHQYKSINANTNTAQYIIWVKLPAIQDLFIRRFQWKAMKIVNDSSHPMSRPDRRELFVSIFGL